MQFYSKIVLFFSVIFILIACERKLGYIKGNDCKLYYQFLEHNWVKHDNGFYQFKTTDEFWEQENYFTLIKEGCLLGLQKDAITSLFGIPTKVYAYHGIDKMYDTIIYCMDEKCSETPSLSKGFWIEFHFGENGNLIDISSSPGVTTGVKSDNY